MNTITKSELEEMMKGNEDVLIVNVLPEEYFRKKHIPGSINIPLKDNESLAKEVEARATSKDQRVVLYCAKTDCDLSEKAYRKLEEAGFSKLADYSEGTKGWFDDHESSQAA